MRFLESFPGRHPLASQRGTLWVGLGAMLFLIGLVAYQGHQMLHQIEAGNTTIRKEMIRRDVLLDRIGADLLKSSIDVRDYVVEAEPTNSEDRRARLRAIPKQIMQDMEQYQRDLEPKEAAKLRQLDKNLRDYFADIELVLNWNAEYRRVHGTEFLREVMAPQRDNVLQIVDQVAAIDDRQMQAAEDDIVTIYANFHRQLLESSGLILCVGLMMGVFGIRHINRLEQISKDQYREAVEAKAQLRKLNARLVTVEEEERRRISRELHDEVGQNLSAALLELSHEEAAASPRGEVVSRHLSNSRKLLESCIGQVRNLALLLRPSMLDDLGLIAALKWNARETFRRTGVPIDVATEGLAEEFPNETRTCIYRVVRESINNSVRHSRPTGVRVTLRKRGSDVEVSIQDDGQGFDPQSTKGLGTIGMQERVHTLGGQFHIDSAPGSGTVVSLMLPIHDGNG